MVELMLKLCLAHLLGDFVFQSNKMVKDIENNALKSKWLYIHIAIHLGITLIFLQFEKQYIFPAILLAISHFLIDVITKIAIRDKIKSTYNFLLDQMLHIIAIAVFIMYFYGYDIDCALLFNTKSYLFAVCILSITAASSIFIKKIMELFAYTLPNNGIKDAGKYIGMLERLFVFLFVISSFWEGIGFLLAAKSIFRFGDLKQNKEIRLTEYILIGTLISFGIAILVGIFYLKVMEIIVR